MDKGIIYVNKPEAEKNLIFIPEVSMITGLQIRNFDGTIKEIVFDEPIVAQGLCEYDKETGTLTFMPPVS